MAKNKAKPKKLSFRQRLREAAEMELGKVYTKAHLAIGDIALEHGLRPVDLAKLLSGGQTKTLNENMVTTLANRKEAELEQIYNTQLDLIPESKDADKKEA